MDAEPLQEVPQNLSTLIRLVVRGFYSIEDTLIIDMLIRNNCMSEEDLIELLKFDQKMLRQRVNTLKTDKFLQSRMKMVTLDDGKTQRETYYFINYKSFVNVIKYKLDHIRKKLEMEERDQTSRASFVCNYCQKTYTDLDADQLLDIMSGLMLCIICRQEVHEDMSGMPRHDTRIFLTRFNDQMEPLFTLLREVENIKLDAKFSEPQPKDFSDLKKPGAPKQIRNAATADDPGRAWSGDATKKSGFSVEGSIDVNINSEETGEEEVKAKERPVWLTEATALVMTSEATAEAEAVVAMAANKGKSKSAAKTEEADDVLMLLQQHEKSNKKNRDNSDSDSDSDGPSPAKKQSIPDPAASLGMPLAGFGEDIEMSDGDSDDEIVPTVKVGAEQVPITDVDNAVIARMTQDEKNQYIQVYQEYMASHDD